VYDLLQVRLEEVGESFYNLFIPDVILDLQQVLTLFMQFFPPFSFLPKFEHIYLQKGLVKEEEGMLVIMQEEDGFPIPLILRKSDGNCVLVTSCLC
jgi:hypothetical protein